MNKILAIYDVIDDFSRINSAEELVAVYQRLILQFGFKVFCIGDVSSPLVQRPNRIWAASWPDGWAKMFVEKNFASVDPIVHQMLVQHTGFRWRDIRRRVRGVAAKHAANANDPDLKNAVAHLKASLDASFAALEIWLAETETDTGSAAASA